MYKVIFYTKQNRASPIHKFLDFCQTTLRAKILRQFLYVEEFGLNPEIPNIKKIRKTSIWELRVLGKNNVRIFCAVLSKKQVIVLHIFKKKQQKTPMKELDKALKRYRELDL